jgi:hypothetical protein
MAGTATLSNAGRQRFMTESQLERLVRLHNWQQFALGVGLSVAAIVLWIVSFLIWRGLALVWLHALSVGNPREKSLLIAIGLTIVLAIDGFRYRKKLFDLIEFHDSIYYTSSLRESGSLFAMNVHRGDPMALAYLVSQVLFCAPRTTVLALNHFRSILRPTSETVANATQVYAELKSRRAWMAVREFENRGAELCILDKLDLIWTEFEDHEFQVRVPPVSSAGFGRS